MGQAVIYEPVSVRLFWGWVAPYNTALSLSVSPTLLFTYLTPFLRLVTHSTCPSPGKQWCSINASGMDIRHHNTRWWHHTTEVSECLQFTVCVWSKNNFENRILSFLLHGFGDQTQVSRFSQQMLLSTEPSHWLQLRVLSLSYILFCVYHDVLEAVRGQLSGASSLFFHHVDSKE